MTDQFIINTDHGIDVVAVWDESPMARGRGMYRVRLAGSGRQIGVVRTEVDHGVRCWRALADAGNQLRIVAFQPEWAVNAVVRQYVDNVKTVHPSGVTA